MSLTFEGVLLILTWRGLVVYLHHTENVDAVSWFVVKANFFFRCFIPNASGVLHFTKRGHYIG